MTSDTNSSSCECVSHKKIKCGGASCCVYGLAFLGAAVYYIQQATTFWAGVLGVLKALVWPAMVIYKAMGLLGM